jgi:hypothetical protein
VLSRWLCRRGKPSGQNVRPLYYWPRKQAFGVNRQAARRRISDTGRRTLPRDKRSTIKVGSLVWAGDHISPNGLREHNKVHSFSSWSDPATTRRNILLICIHKKTRLYRNRNILTEDIFSLLTPWCITYLKRMFQHLWSFKISYTSGLKKRIMPVLCWSISFTWSILRTRRFGSILYFSLHAISNYYTDTFLIPSSPSALQLCKSPGLP